MFALVFEYLRKFLENVYSHISQETNLYSKIYLNNFDPLEKYHLVKKLTNIIYYFSNVNITLTRCNSTGSKRFPHCCVNYFPLNVYNKLDFQLRQYHLKLTPEIIDRY